MENSSKKNYHMRNMEHLKLIKEKNTQKRNKLQAEKERMQQLKQNLANLILKRSEQKYEEQQKQKHSPVVNSISKPNSIPKQTSFSKPNPRRSSIEIATPKKEEFQLFRHTFSCMSEPLANEIASKFEVPQKKQLSDNEATSKIEITPKKQPSDKEAASKLDISPKKQPPPSPPKVKKVDENHLNRLAKPAQKPPTITDMAYFKKKHQIEPNCKVFIVTGGYSRIVKSLVQRNWCENPDKTSPCFDFIWTLSVKDIDYPNLQEHQMCNHFQNSSAITTKVGLSNTLKSLKWFENADLNSFFPRCFDLSDTDDKEDFITEFKLVQAENILKKLVLGDTVSEKQAKAAMDVSKRRLVDFDDLIDSKEDWKLIHPKEWEILSEGLLTEDELRLQKYKKYMQSPDMKPRANTKPKRQQNFGKAENRPEVIEEARELLAQLRHSQTEINGRLNIWIVKPGRLSRGRGIACYNSLAEIMDHISKEKNWVVQKYIENPLIINSKKFDIRQWVLVTSWNPLTIWFYDKSYCRFTVEDFSLFNLQDVYVHLTNNSVAKHSENFYCEESMWNSDEFAEHLQQLTGRDIWQDSLKQRIKKIVKWSLKAAQDCVNNRKNSFELFGYDFMIDEEYNPWLIEINKSPAMDYSTPVTKQLVKMVLEDTIKVVVDYHFASDRRKPKVDTGHFTRIYKAKHTVDRPIQSMGLNLVCEGKKFRKNR